MDTDYDSPFNQKTIVNPGHVTYLLDDDTQANVEIDYDGEDGSHSSKLGDMDIPMVNKHCLPREISEMKTSLDLLIKNDKLFSELPTTESGSLLKRIFASEGVGAHHIEIFNHWLDCLISNNIYSKCLICSDGSKITFSNVRIEKPTYDRGLGVFTLTPKMSREQGLTYGINLYIDLIKLKPDNTNYYIDGKIDENFIIRNILVAKIPIMLKSTHCYLKGKNAMELAMYGEDPDDHGGYFIVEGNEKVVLGQEQMITDKMLLMNFGDHISSKLTSNTPGGTVVMEIRQNPNINNGNNDVIEIFLPKLKPPSDTVPKSINVLRIFRLFANWESSKGNNNELSSLDNTANIKEFISRFIKDDPDIRKKSILKLNITLMDFNLISDDLKIISETMERSKNPVTDEEVLNILKADLYPHLNKLPHFDNENVDDYKRRIIISKLNLLAIMTARLLEYLAGFRNLDDRDSWSNKRVEGAGRLMENLFRVSWKKTLEIIQGKIVDTKLLGTKNDIAQLAALISSSSTISTTYRDSFISGKWGMKGTVLKDAVAQPLNRDGVVATLAHINTIDVAISRTDRQHILRLVQMSQFGFISHFFTPEGKGCGLLKNSTILTKLTVGRDDRDIITGLMRLKRVVALSYAESVEHNLKDKIVVGGKFIGWCNGDKVRDDLVNKRRSGVLNYDMSVIKENDFVYVDVSPSRPIRPMLLVNPQSNISLNEPFLVIDQKKMRNASNNDLIVNGCMEYVSPWEQEYIQLAMSKQRNIDRTNEINNAMDALKQENLLKQVINSNPEKRGLTKEGVEIDIKEAENRVKQALETYNKIKNTTPFTHCEIDPLDLTDIAASLIPWPDHNQAPRNTYQVSMGKQALGSYHSNHLNRMNDGHTKILASPQRPMVSTDIYGVIGLDDKGPGKNMVQQFLAVPYTEEDSFLMKKEFLDLGGMRMYKYITYKTIVGDGETLKRPVLKGIDLDKNGHRYRYITENGLPMIGAHMREGDFIICKLDEGRNKSTKSNMKTQITPNYGNSIQVRVGDEGVVEKVTISSYGAKTMVFVKMRIMRVPQEGDKYAPRNAQKGTIGLVISDLDLQYGLRGTTADITANCHCFTADTPVSLKNGLSRPLTSLLYDGGDKVLSWDYEKMKTLFGKSAGYESNGIQNIVKLTFSDGRIIKCTPNHKFPVMEVVDGVNVYNKVRADKITKEMYLMANYDSVLDVPGNDENDWEYKTEWIHLKMNNNNNRDKALAFARLLGFTCADGTVCQPKDRSSVVCVLYMGSRLDTDVILDDIEILTHKRPKICEYSDEKFGNVFRINLPASLARAVGILEGMTIGRRTENSPEWPNFLFDDKCPKSIIREFLGGLFGGDGWCPYLITNKQDGQGTVTFNPPAISLSDGEVHSEELINKMKDIDNLLEKVGVSGSRVDKPKKYKVDKSDGTTKTNVTCCLQLPRGTEFGDKVGFRYCVQKMFRMAAYQSYMRYLENVKRQNDTIVRRASEIYDNKEVGNSLQRALDKSRLELFLNEAPFNDYYSNATLDHLRNRRRKDRHNELIKWDYKFIEDADKYLHKIKAYHWFRTEEGKGGAEYIVDREEVRMPNFYIKLHDIRDCGKEEVFDFGVEKTHYLSANNTVVLNSLPSRMTCAYPQEEHGAKAGAMSGKHINAGAHHPYERDKYRNILKRYGLHEYAYEEMRSGTTGNYLEVLVFSGSIFFQALKHHVKDKIQARGTGQFNPQTRQPLRGRTNHGGLRFGEMERDVAIAYGASAFLRERLMGVSDEYHTVFCIVCGNFAVNNPQSDSFRKCSLCGNEIKFGRTSIPYVYKLLIHLLAAIGLNLRPEVMTNSDYAKKLLSIGRTEEEDYDENQIDEADDAEQAEEADDQLMDEEDGESYYDEGGF